MWTHHALQRFTCHFGTNRSERKSRRALFDDALDEVRREFDFLLWAYVFMPEHVHLLVWPNEKVYDIGNILKAIKQPVGTRAVKHMRRHAPSWLPRITVGHIEHAQRRFWQAASIGMLSSRASFWR